MPPSTESPPWSLDRRPRLVASLLVALLVLGALPKIAFLLTRGALWGDEAALAMNIVPQGFLEMGRPFVYLQVCPWGAMAAIKVTTLIFGTDEVGYRAFPTIASVAAMALAYPLGRRLYGAAAGLFAVFFLGTTYWMTYFAGELKPYTTDALVAVLLTWLCARVLDAPEDDKAWGVLVVAGLAAGWTSLPSLFVLGGCGLALVIAGLMARRGVAHLVKLGALGAAWVGAFVVHYLGIIVQSAVASDKKAVSFWNDGFAPFPPTSLAALRWYPGKFFFFFESPGGLSIRYLAGLLFLYGVFVLVKRRRYPQVALLLLPAILAISASAFGKYPALGRLLLFTVPSAMVVLGVGLADLLEAPKAFLRPVAVVIALVLVVPGLGRTYESVWNHPQRVELPEVMERIAEDHRPGDVIFMAGGGMATIYDFYYQRYGLPKKGYVGVDNLRSWDEDKNYPALRELVDKSFGRPRVWLVASTRQTGIDEEKVGRSDEPYARFIPRYFERWGGVRALEMEAEDMNLYLYDMSAATATTTVELIRNPR